MPAKITEADHRSGDGSITRCAPEPNNVNADKQGVRCDEAMASALCLCSAHQHAVGRRRCDEICRAIGAGMLGDSEAAVELLERTDDGGFGLVKLRPRL